MASNDVNMSKALSGRNLEKELSVDVLFRKVKTFTATRVGQEWSMKSVVRKVNPDSFYLGETLSREDLAIKTSDPQGCEPVDWEKLIGNAVKRDVDADSPIFLEDV